MKNAAKPKHIKDNYSLKLVVVKISLVNLRENKNAIQLCMNFQNEEI